MDVPTYTIDPDTGRMRYGPEFQQYVLHAYESMPIDEAAELVGLSRSKLYNLASYARHKRSVAAAAAAKLAEQLAHSLLHSGQDLTQRVAARPPSGPEQDERIQ